MVERHIHIHVHDAAFAPGKNPASHGKRGYLGSSVNERPGTGQYEPVLRRHKMQHAGMGLYENRAGTKAVHVKPNGHWSGSSEAGEGSGTTHHELHTFLSRGATHDYGPGQNPASHQHPLTAVQLRVHERLTKAGHTYEGRTYGGRTYKWGSPNEGQETHAVYSHPTEGHSVVSPTGRRRKM